MNNIKLARVDDRLIHGQVVTNWIPNTGVKEVVIVDDSTANDSFTARIIAMAAPQGVKVNILTVKDGIDYLSENPKAPTMLLAKTPGAFLELVKNGVGISKVNLGGMGARKDRHTLYKNISASEEERSDIRELIANNVDVVVQIISSDKAVPVTDKML